jgi:dipeptidyl-peptidase 9
LYICSRFSREEQLLWERRRVATWGITSYELHQETGKLVFPAASSLFQCLDTGFMVINIIKDKYI